MIDLDDFKEINDFWVIKKELTFKRHCKSNPKSVREIVHLPRMEVITIMPTNEILEVLSISVANYPEAGISIDQITHKADQLMYSSKIKRYRKIARNNLFRRHSTKRC